MARVRGPAWARAPSGRRIRTNTVRGSLWMIAGIMVSCISILSIRELSVSMSTVEMVFFRHFFGLMFVIPWLLREGPKVLYTKQMPLYALRAGLSFCGGNAWMYAIGAMALADVIALQFTMPLFTLVLAIVFLREVVGMDRALATVIGFLGALLILRPGFAEIGLPVAAALTGAATAAASNIVIKFLARTESAGTIVFYLNASVSLIALVPALFVWTTPAWSDLPWLIALGFGFTAANYCRVRSLAIAEATVVTPFEFLRLPIVAAIGYLLFGEVSSLWTWVGAAVIFASTTFVARRAARREAAMAGMPGNGEA